MLRLLNYVRISIPYILPPPPPIRQKNPVYEPPNLSDKVKFWSLFLLAHLPKNLKNLIFWLGFCANFPSISSVTRNCFVKTSETDVRPHVLGNTHDRTGSICVYVRGGGRWVCWGIMQKERTHPDFRTPKVSISAILPPSFGLTSLS